MLKLLITLLTQLFFSKPPGVPHGAPPPAIGSFMPALDVEFFSTLALLRVGMPRAKKASFPLMRRRETRYVSDDPTFSL